MEKLNFDLEKFFSLPTCRGQLTDGQGRFDAIGAFNEVCGYPQQYMELEDLTDCPDFAGMVIRINDSIHPELAKTYLVRQLKHWELI